MGQMPASEVHSRPVQESDKVLGAVAENRPEVLIDFKEVLHPVLFGVLDNFSDVFEVDLMGMKCFLDELFMIVRRV